MTNILKRIKGKRIARIYKIDLRAYRGYGIADMPNALQQTLWAVKLCSVRDFETIAIAFDLGF